MRSSTKRSSNTPNKDQISILLVDDYEMIRVVVRRALADMGYTNVHDATGGQDALDKVRAAVAAGKPFDLVFCDWNMPEVNGLDVLTALRVETATKTLPVIMLTAESEKSSIVRALKAGANDYLIKPVAANILGEKLERQLAKGQKRAA